VVPTILKNWREQSYEKQLHGITGFEEVETDSRPIHPGSISAPPTPGNNLILSLILDYRKRQKRHLAIDEGHW
jgi:penicillin-binding protein 2